MSTPGGTVRGLLEALRYVANATCRLPPSGTPCDMKGAPSWCVHQEARRALADYAALTPTLPEAPPRHNFADCITSDDAKPCRDCAEYALDAAGAPAALPEAPTTPTVCDRHGAPMLDATLNAIEARLLCGSPGSPAAPACPTCGDGECDSLLPWDPPPCPKAAAGTPGGAPARATTARDASRPLTFAA